MVTYIQYMVTTKAVSSFLSIHDDNTVRAYVDCRWLRTDVLEKDALDTPRDADLIIGYLFSVSTSFIKANRKRTVKRGA